MLLKTDDRETTTRDDPQALIEEARQVQRQRARRRTIVVQAAALLVILGFGINHFARGDNSAPQPPRQPPSGAVQGTTVTYEKILEQKIVPHLPTETRTIETWYSQASGREVITLSGGGRFEIGFIRVRDKVLGPEQVNYLYDPSTNIIYRAGYILIPAIKPPTPEQFFKQQILGGPAGARLVGTRTYKGRRVYVVKSAHPFVRTTTFVDKRSYQVLFGVGTSHDLRTVQRGLAFRTLPATKANLALTSLQTTHPHARTVLKAPPRIRQLYADAAYFSGPAKISPH